MRNMANIKIEVSVEEIIEILREKYKAPNAGVTFQIKSGWQGDQRDGYHVTELESATISGVAWPGRVDDNHLPYHH